MCITIGTYTIKSFPSFFSFTGKKRKRGKKCEKGDHLGNVSVVVSDRKLPVDDNNDGTVDWYRAEVRSATDYYPFGSILPGRNFNSTEYRYSINGQEKVDEISGSGNHTTALFWEYDTRLGRRWNTDPKPSAWESPYAVFKNNPLTFTDMLGDTPTVAEAAKMQDFTYNLKEGYTGSISGSSLGGWDAQSMVSSRKSGFKSALFRRDLGEGKSEYSYVFAGTDDWEDVKTDASMYFEPVAQMNLALEYAQQYSKKFKGSELTLVGHSLGGWLASGSALKTGRPAITFNAPGINSYNRSYYGLNKIATINAYVLEGEALNFNLSPFGLGATGQTTILKADYSFISAQRWYQRASNHTMDAVIDKLQQQGKWQYQGQFTPTYPLPSFRNFIAKPDATRVGY